MNNCMSKQQGWVRGGISSQKFDLLPLKDFLNCERSEPVTVDFGMSIVTGLQSSLADLRH